MIWFRCQTKVLHVLRLMPLSESVRGEPGPASALSFKYNLGRRRLSPALFLHHRDYMWRVTLHAVSRETLWFARDTQPVARQHRTRVTVRVVWATPTARVSGGARGVPLGRRPRASPPHPRAVCSAAQPPHGSGEITRAPSRDHATLIIDTQMWRAMRFIDANCLLWSTRKHINCTTTSILSSNNKLIVEDEEITQAPNMITKQKQRGIVNGQVSINKIWGK